MTSPAIAQTSPEAPQSPCGALFLRRAYGMFLRHLFLHTGSLPRVIEMMYWPAINILLMGFTSFYIVKKIAGAFVFGNVVVSGALLNEVFVRMTVTILMLFMEEIWSRNLGHLFASPIKLSEYTFSLAGIALTRMTIAIIPAMYVAYWLFGFSILSLGWPLLAFYILLAMSGCWYGLIIVSILLRFGLAAEWFGWMGVFLLSPFIAPYYPVSILPPALQCVSWSLPPTYVFDAMKQILAGNGLNIHDLWMALALNAVYFVFASIIYTTAYRSARRRGGILQVGE